MAPWCLSGSIPGSFALEWVIKGEVSSPLYLRRSTLQNYLPVIFSPPFIFFCSKSHWYLSLRVFRGWSQTLKRDQLTHRLRKSCYSRREKASIGNELRNLPASVSQVLGLKTWATPAWLPTQFLRPVCLGIWGWWALSLKAEIRLRERGKQGRHWNLCALLPRDETSYLGLRI